MLSERFLLLQVGEVSDEDADAVETTEAVVAAEDLLLLLPLPATRLTADADAFAAVAEVAEEVTAAAEDELALAAAVLAAVTIFPEAVGESPV